MVGVPHRPLLPSIPTFQNDLSATSTLRQPLNPSPPPNLGPLNKKLKRFRGGLVFQARRLCVPLNFRLESNKEEEGQADGGEASCGGKRGPAHTLTEPLTKL